MPIRRLVVAVPGLTAQKQTLFAVYHPGRGWFDRAFRTSELRGVLGYWYRSPGRGRDVEIITEFTERLRGASHFFLHGRPPTKALGSRPRLPGQLWSARAAGVIPSLRSRMPRLARP